MNQALKIQNHIAHANRLRTWARCDVCGRMISQFDFNSGKAMRRMVTPDSDYSSEEWETLCKRHRNE